MSLNDTIADMLTRIRNAVRVKSLSVNVPNYKMNRAILDVLKTEGYIKNYEVYKSNSIKDSYISVFLKYLPDSTPSILSIDRVSKSGMRAYSSIKDLKTYFNGLGMLVLSTSKGVISDKVARKMHIGGEVLCRVF